MNELYEIKHRFTGKVLFSLECGSLKLCVEAGVEAGANLSRADLYGANLYGADLSGADLYGANLSRADLYEADLYRANLSRANLSGANLYRADGEKIIIQKTPIQISTGIYNIIIFDAHMKIGCEFHPLEKWWNFTDKEIIKMDNSRAKKFWDTWKEPLQKICEANDRK